MAEHITMQTHAYKPRLGADSFQYNNSVINLKSSATQPNAGVATDRRHSRALQPRIRAPVMMWGMTAV